MTKARTRGRSIARQNPIQKVWSKFLFPLIVLVWIIIQKILILATAILWVCTPFFWYLGAKGTVRLIEAVEEAIKASSPKEKDMRLLRLCVIAFTIIVVLIGAIVYSSFKEDDSRIVHSGSNSSTSNNSGAQTPIITKDSSNEKSKDEVPEVKEPRKTSGDEAWYYLYDFSESNINTSLSQEEYDYLILCIQHECGHTGELFIECNDFGFIQRSLAKSFLNQRKNLGCTTIQETISDTQIFGSLNYEITTIYEILKNGGSLKEAGIENSELYDLNDLVTINNIETVLNGLDEVPENALFWRNEDGEYAEEAYEVFLTYFSENADLTRYLSVKVKDWDTSNPYGYYWMLFAQDNNFQP